MAGDEVHGMREAADPDLRALQVLQDRERRVGAAGDAPEARDQASVVGACAVGEVDPRHVHARREQALEHLLAVARGADRRDDLSSGGR